ncbi:YesL family protein [Halobacillus salinarum]|uniref:YesL family protein n=1 Tax=Halobacillus salinarum TaxID=2932257 RepID=A0ABY4EMW5_9BACI|nr:YesL family protein [Halobacillus salinarum]UOQ45802.1 YesL family protein [Halobacillus salinarum]
MHTGLGFLKIPEWIVKFAYLNLLWFCFSLLGGIVLGVFPATTAMFAVVRQWLLGETEIPVFKRFWKFYKQDFLRSSLLGYVLFAVGFTLYVDFMLLDQSENSFRWLHFLLLILSSIYVLTLLYAFPVFVHYQMKVFQVLKTAFLVMVISPLSTIMMIAGTLIIYIVILYSPSFLPIFSASLLSFLIMWAAVLSFQKIDKKNKVTKQAS